MDNENTGDARKGGPHGPGGLATASNRNPNSHPDLNDAPDGPRSHGMGFTEDGGVTGDATTTHRGAKYHFK